MPTNSGEIIIYSSVEGQIEFQVNLQKETVWLSLDQMVKLFGRDKSVISRHLKNIFSENELEMKSVVAKFATTAADGKTYQVDHYSLDVVISVGYRVRSLQGTKFRIWANGIIRKHILEGYTLNQKRLQEKGLAEFEEAVGLIRRTVETKMLSDDESRGLLEVITTYASTWALLQKYDNEGIAVPKTKRARGDFDYEFCRRAIDEIRRELIKKGEASELFGNESGEQFKGIIGNIHQTFDQKALYPSIEERSAHLLYFVIKDHPFTDGNKRIGAFLFIVFLARHDYLYRLRGEKKINDNALTALALLIAESQPRQKELMVRLVMHFLAEG